jgi:hypothetical protein
MELIPLYRCVISGAEMSHFNAQSTAKSATTKTAVDSSIESINTAD